MFEAPSTNLMNDNSMNDNSMNDNSMNDWVQSTDKALVTISRNFLIDVLKYIELNRYTDQFISHNLKERWDMKKIKDWLNCL